MSTPSSPISDQSTTGVSQSGRPPCHAGLGLWLVRLALVAAMAIAGYLAYAALFAGGKVAGCGDDSSVGCGHVLRSRWATWFGIPVGVPALLIYVVAMTSTWCIAASTPARQRFGWTVLTGAAIAIGGAAIWFTGLQLLSLGNLCWYCLTLHACGLVLAGYVAWRLPQQLVGGIAAVRPVVVSSLVGAFAVAALVGGQLLVAPPRPEMQITEVRRLKLPFDIGPKIDPESDRPTPVSPSADAKSPRRADHPWPHRRLSLLGGNVSLDMSDYPVRGDREAPRPIVEMFDYTCAHCRELHNLLEQAQEEFGDQLTLVLLPVPMNPDCNPSASVRHNDHATACELARIALAVWQAKPDAFAGFHHDLMQGAKPPTPAAAETAAINLLGNDVFRQALNDPAVEVQMKENCRIYSLAKESTGDGAIPKLLYEQAVSSGLPSSLESLRQFLKSQVGLNPNR